MDWRVAEVAEPPAPTTRKEWAQHRLHEQPTLQLCVFLHLWRELQYASTKVQPQLRELLAVLLQENSMTLSVAVDVVVEAVMVAVVVVQQ